MRIIVAVVVYNRFKNIEEWIRSWKLCSKEGAELMIIHNYDDELEQVRYRELCQISNIHYIPRKNIGMDIGAFQDVCRGRLEGFPNEWDYLLWCTDDLVVMNKKFVSHYITAIKRKNVGVVCLEISREVKIHIRTTGFMIDQLTASKINFPNPIICTKDHCYAFEHRDKNAFYEQVKAMGKIAFQVHPDLKKSYLWDSHVRAHYKRWPEYYREFPKS